MCPGNLRGCSRGIYGLSSWEPLRRPGEAEPPQRAAESRQTPGQQTDSGKGSSSMAAAAPKPAAAAATNPAGDKSKRRKMIAKYTYKRNENSPLGTELSVQQKDPLTRLKIHEENENWWLAENEKGDVGWVPASYMMILEEKPSSLPWLNKEPEEEKPAPVNSVFGAPSDVKPKAKPYRSAYNHDGLPKQEGDDLSQFYCDVCEKQLNGPKPYQAHMVSKAHKEELEYRNGEP